MQAPLCSEGATTPGVDAENSFSINGLEEGNIIVMDITGRIMLQQAIKGNQPVIVSALPAGLYTVQLQTAEGIQRTFRLSKL